MKPKHTCRSWAVSTGKEAKMGTKKFAEVVHSLLTVGM
jgi:hypothetical protein